jgi:hypothetical protein
MRWVERQNGDLQNDKYGIKIFAKFGTVKRRVQMRLSVRLIALGLIGILGATRGLAQQDPQFSLYMFNQQVLNPAYCGAPRAPQIIAADVRSG